MADKAGLERETVEALAAGRTPEAMPDDQRVAHAFARHLAAEHKVAPELHARAEEQFGRAGIVDMVHLTSFYMATSMLLNAFAVPVPPGDV